MEIRKRIASVALAVSVVATGLTAAQTATAAPATPVNVPCERHIAKDRVYRYSGFNFVTDSKGRPISGSGRVTRQTRQRTPCETTVGRWGGTNFQGAHLIASSLNGISRRYNLVPATKEVNLGLMKAFENAAKRCLRTGNTVLYTVALGYTNNDVVPDNFVMSMTIGVQQVRVTMTFKNKHYGRAFLTQKKRKLSDDLRAANCVGS